MEILSTKYCGHKNLDCHNKYPNFTSKSGLTQKNFFIYIKIIYLNSKDKQD